MKKIKHTRIPLFPGFRKKYTKDFFTYPLVLTEWWKYLLGSEQKILDFILRQTLGWKKTSDKISLSQFMNGNSETNTGTNLSISQIRRALQSLEDKGFIVLEKKFRKVTQVSLRLSEIEDTSTRNIDSSYDNIEVIRFIKMFEPVAGNMVEKYLSSKTQIRAMESVLVYYGLEKTEQLIAVLPTSNSTPYFPKIHSPVDLQNKAMQLIASLQRKSVEKKTNGVKLGL